MIRSRFLDALGDSPAGLPISRIADAIGVDRQRAGRLTTELLAEGLVTRGAAPEDSRYALVGLTAQGRELVAAINENRRRAVVAALSGFTAEESRTLAALLHRFVDAWPREP
ncbi:MarR family winged helix-turn-helix transcriptional regulator [Winogradskya humida]|uniref:HTH marR-type domain-containing protein n=1 Tax=Winogradskya humida TaxID=113566 RepID=A0ABQ4A0S1_9ACTN|nr:MarR family transcriptional regulator [Actinoplanes humidus]GIE24218.1 hypothetical protein Ahu01nite_073200 [Actinoplanes humidus]